MMADKRLASVLQECRVGCCRQVITDHVWDVNQQQAQDKVNRKKKGSLLEDGVYLDSPSAKASK
jgi:hypothetical protein